MADREKDKQEYLDRAGLELFYDKIRALIPGRVSQLDNDIGFLKESTYSDEMKRLYEKIGDLESKIDELSKK